MRYLSYIVLLLAGVVVQVGVLRFASVKSVAPDLLLLATVVVGLRSGQIPGMVFGFLAGLAIDLVTATLVGPSALSKTVVGFIAGLWHGYTVSLSKNASLLVLFVCVSLHELLMAAVQLLAPGANFGFVLLRWTLPRAIYSLALGMVLFLLLPHKVWRARATPLFRGRA
ncbi:MAG: rod shape-determining protein MreD [Halothiobacillaceae bacterium]